MKKSLGGGVNILHPNWNRVNDIKEIDEHIITDNKHQLDQILLYGNERYRYGTNRIIFFYQLLSFL